MAGSLPGNWKTTMTSKLTPLLTAPLVLGVMACNSAATLPNCTAWNSSRFFKEASSDDVARCLSEGADLSVRDKDGWVPLHRAAEYSQIPAVVQALLDAGADPNARNEGGWTPLHAAETPAAVQALLDAGADPNARSGGGWTPLHRAAVGSETPAVVQALLDAGADLNMRAGLGSTPLHLAAERSQTPAVVQALLDAGADPNAQDDVGRIAWDLIPDDSPLNGTDVYWQLNNARF